MVFTRSKSNPDVLEANCDKCQTEYTFVPSKYYKLASKRIVYFKSEKSSRLVEIKNADGRKMLPAGTSNLPIKPAPTIAKAQSNTTTALSTYVEGHTTK